MQNFLQFFQQFLPLTEPHILVLLHKANGQGHDF